MTSAKTRGEHGAQRRVERHAIDVTGWERTLANARNELRDIGSTDRPITPLYFNYAATMGAQILARASVIDRDAGDLPEAAAAVAQGQAGLLAYASAAPGTTLTLPLCGRLVTLEKSKAVDASLANIGAWHEGWQAALVARDGASLDHLATVPGSLLRASATESDDYQYVWKDALIAAHRGEPAVGTLVERAVAAVSDATIATELARRKARALFPLLEHIRGGNADAFQDGLEAVLVAHRAVFEGQKRVSPGFVAFDALALACLAHDSGMKILVDSDYLLPNLIEGSREPEAR